MPVAQCQPVNPDHPQELQQHAYLKGGGPKVASPKKSLSCVLRGRLSQGNLSRNNNIKNNSNTSDDNEEMTSTSQSAKDAANIKLSALSAMAGIRPQGKMCRRVHKKFSSKDKQISGERTTKSTRNERRTIHDVELGKGKPASRYCHQPIHQRLFNYLRKLFQNSTTLHDSELEEFDNPVRYRPESLLALCRGTHFTEDEVKRIYRCFKSECPTGIIKEDTFKLIYCQFFPNDANPAMYAHYVFNTLDQERNGLVNFEHFIKGLSTLLRGSVEDKLRWTFSLYDTNADGVITKDEVANIVAAVYNLMGQLPSEGVEDEKIKSKVDQIFQRIDTNTDGVVTLQEFLEACLHDETILASMSAFSNSF